MEFKKEQDEENGVYSIIIDGKKAAEMTFAVRPGRIIILHTEVNSDYQGQGLGKAIVEKAIKDARDGQYSIVPMCAYAKLYFQRHPEAKDVL